jgi:hypothetical protein
MSTLLLVCGLVALGFGIWYVFRKGPKGTEERHYRTLLQQAGGDTALANRLIDYELRRSPDLTRDKAIQSAIWRLDRDRS